MGNLYKKQLYFQKILWSALLFSNIAICLIIYLDFFKLQKIPQSGSVVTMIPYSITLILLVTSFIIFRSTRNEKKLEQKFQEMSSEISPKSKLTPSEFEEFNSMSDSEKKKYLLQGQLLSKYTLTWSLAEGINIMGMAGIALGMPKDHYYTFFAVAIGLMFIYFPSENESLKKL